MKKILKTMAYALAIGVMVTLQSCDNFGRDVKKTWDAGPVENVLHGGTFKGYAAVYTIDWMEGTQTRSSGSYRVYMKDDGEYVIDYEGETYILQKVAEPIGEEPFALKWKINYNHYIEDVPHSY